MLAGSQPHRGTAKSDHTPQKSTAPGYMHTRNRQRQAEQQGWFTLTPGNSKASKEEREEIKEKLAYKYPARRRQKKRDQAQTQQAGDKQRRQGLPPAKSVWVAAKHEPLPVTIAPVLPRQFTKRATRKIDRSNGWIEPHHTARFAHARIEFIIFVG